jgi:hypothetical protein
MMGRSLFDGGSGDESPEELYFAQGTMIDPNQRAVYQGRYKLMHSPGRRADERTSAGPWALFDLQDDPREERNLLAERPRPPEVERIFTSLHMALDHALPAGAVLEPDHAPIDPELEERLRGLGYLQ